VGEEFQALGRFAAGVIAERTCGVEWIRQQLLHAVEAAGIDLARSPAWRNADVVKLAVGEVGSAVTEPAFSAADKQLQAALGRFGHRALLLCIVLAQPFDKNIKRRPAADQLPLVRCNRFADVAEDSVDGVPIGGLHGLPRAAELVFADAFGRTAAR